MPDEAKQPILTSTQRTNRTLTGNKNSEYDAFHSLARKLVNVPKSEVDEKRAEAGA